MVRRRDTVPKREANNTLTVVIILCQDRTRAGRVGSGGGCLLPLGSVHSIMNDVFHL